MGRKKGKQAGGFYSKAARAAHITQVQNRAFEDTLRYRTPAAAAGWHSASVSSGAAGESSLSLGSNSNNAKTHNSNNDRPRLIINGLGCLRHILEERRMEDRLEGAEVRRRHHRLQRVISETEDNLEVVDSRIQQTAEIVGPIKNEAGWILYYEDAEDKLRKRMEYLNYRQYNHGPPSSSVTRSSSSSAAEHYLRCVDLKKKKKKKDRRRQQQVQSPFPSLVSLCVEATGSVLYRYVQDCGVDTISSILSTLPPKVVTSISIAASSRPAPTGDAGAVRTSGLTDGEVRALASHPNVEMLALHATEGDDDDGGGGCGGYKIETLQCLKPRLGNGHSGGGSEDDKHKGAGGEREEEEAAPPDSWEKLLDVDAHVSFSGCPKLVRLELANVKASSFDNVMDLFLALPSLTHLGLSGCLDETSGICFLANVGSGALLTGLKVLDLSRCTWVCDALLSSFLSRCKARAAAAEANSMINLRLISVTGCPRITKRGINALNMKYKGRPIICAAVRSCVVSASGGECTESASSSFSTTGPSPAITRRTVYGNRVNNTIYEGTNLESTNHYFPIMSSIVRDDDDW